MILSVLIGGVIGGAVGGALGIGIGTGIHAIQSSINKKHKEILRNELGKDIQESKVLKFRKKANIIKDNDNSYYSSQINNFKKKTKNKEKISDKELAKIISSIKNDNEHNYKVTTKIERLD
jgi:uncharacterized protein YcfJ